MKYANAKTDAAKHSVPEYHYFKKIYSFMDSHCIIGEMFLEYLKVACKENREGTLRLLQQHKRTMLCGD